MPLHGLGLVYDCDCSSLEQCAPSLVNNQVITGVVIDPPPGDDVVAQIVTLTFASECTPEVSVDRVQ